MSKMDLDFSNLAATAPKVPKASPTQVKELARQAGAAEGFTDRAAASGSVQRQLRPPTMQMNVKLPEAVRTAFMEAMEREAATNRAIRSAGDFLELILAEWLASRPKG